MLDPERVRDICHSMMRSVEPQTNGPEITVKCRIGVDDHESYEELHHFITTVASCGVKHFIVHARKCILKGLSPHENRTVPPLKYDVVYRLKSDFPKLRFTLNGGVASIQHAKQLLDETNIDGVMIGRAAYNTPWNLRDADRLIFGEERNPNLSRREIVAKYIDYAEDMQAKWGSTVPLGPHPYTMRTSTLIKPLLALFKYVCSQELASYLKMCVHANNCFCSRCSGEFGSKAYKREITAQWATKGPVPELRAIVEGAVKMIPDEVLDARVEDELS